MSARLEIRIPKEEKEILEKIARMVDISVSELVRSYLIKISEIEKKIEILETARNANRVLTDMLMKFVMQSMLKKLLKYKEKCSTYIGPSGEKLTYFESIACSKWSIEKDSDGKYVVEVMKDYEICNEYGRCWLDYIYFEKIENLAELREFLRWVSDYLGDEITKELKQIKTILRI